MIDTASALVIVTAFLVVATFFVAYVSLLSARASKTLAESAKRQEELTKNQNEKLIQPILAIRRVHRSARDPNKVYIKIENVGMGPAKNAKMTREYFYKKLCFL
jgi:hypothetical protein